MSKLLRSPLLGVVPLLAFCWVLANKASTGKLPDLLWACNVSALLIGVGTLASWRRLVAIPFLFHASVGLPAWLLDVSATGTTYGASATCHASTAIVGALAARRLGLPARCVPAAFAYWVVLLAASFWLTPPALNVNLVFAPWDPLAATWGSVWVSHGANLLGVALFLLAGNYLLRVRLGWRAPGQRPTSDAQAGLLPLHQAREGAHGEEREDLPRA